MQTFTYPARYAPEIDAALASAVRAIELDMKLRALGDDSTKYADVDETRSGNVVVLVGSTTSEKAG